MQTHISLKRIVLLLVMALPAVWSSATTNHALGEYSAIQIKESSVQGTPRGSIIHAFLNDHYLTVSFSQDFGQVTIEVSTASGLFVDSVNLLVSTGWQFYIPDEGEYVVTITFADGDEYYGEFTITD